MHIITKAHWAHFRIEKNYIFRELTRNFRELTRNFRELTRNFRVLTRNCWYKSVQSENVHIFSPEPSSLGAS